LFVQGLLADGTITRTELDSGKPDPGSRRETPRVTPAMIAEQFARTTSVSLRRDDVTVAARFAAGAGVRARNLNPVGHTRLPRYLRDKQGVVFRDHGVFDLQDTDADGYSLGEKPQHVYTVRFTARELWGEQANSRDVVFAELWEDYLEDVA
jgi:nitrile hydratase